MSLEPNLFPLVNACMCSTILWLCMLILSVQRTSEFHRIWNIILVWFTKFCAFCSVSSLAWFMSLQERSFVTLGQRVLAKPLKFVSCQFFYSSQLNGNQKSSWWSCCPFLLHSDLEYVHLLWWRSYVICVQPSWSFSSSEMSNFGFHQV